jgi:parvulin-like peptidyl-prolyl isomerase
MTLPHRIMFSALSKCPLLTITALSAILTTHVCAGADEAKQAADAGVLGRIGESEIQVENVRRFLAGLTPIQAEAVRGDPALLNQLVRSFLVQTIVLKEALDKKWDEQPEVAAQLARVRESTLTDSYLQAQCKAPEGYPNEEELKAAYDANKAALLVPRSFRLAQIFVSDPKNSDDPVASSKAQQKLTEIRERLKEPATQFATVAQAESEERESASRGGEIGWLAETQIQPEIRDRLPGLDLNATSEPLRLADGWHIIKVLDVREAHTPTLEQVRGNLTEQMRAEKMRANTQEYLAKVLQAHPIAINELLLSKVLERPKP